MIQKNMNYRNMQRIFDKRTNDVCGKSKILKFLQLYYGQLLIFKLNLFFKHKTT